MKSIFRVGIAFVAITASSAFGANVTYSYTGSDLSGSSNTTSQAQGTYSNSQAISAWFTFDMDLGANFSGDPSSHLVAWSTFDGAYAMNNPNSDPTVFGMGFTTDGSGDVINWSLFVGIADPGPTTHGCGGNGLLSGWGSVKSGSYMYEHAFSGGEDCGTTGGDLVHQPMNIVDAGTWTKSTTQPDAFQSTAPEPGTTVLFLGAGAVAVIARRRKANRA